MSTERITTLRQQRDLSQIIEAAFSLYFQNFWPLFRIAAVLIPFSIVGAMITGLVELPEGPLENEDFFPAFWKAMAVIIPFVLLAVMVQWLALIAVVAALADLEAGQPVQFSRAYGVVFNRLWILLGASLRAAFHVFLFYITIIGIPWAIQRGVRWLFIYPAVILDGTSARASLSYSADAVKGRWWRTLGIWIVIVIIATVPSSILSALFGLAPPLVSGTLGGLVSAALIPFWAIALTLLYLDLNARRETDPVELQGGFSPALVER